MTKQHFETFAREIANSSFALSERIAAAWIVIRVARQYNPQFSVKRFLRAANLSEQEQA